MVSIALRILYLIHSDVSKDVPPVAKKRMGKIYQTGLLTFLAGFALWNVDNIYCSTLTEWKKAVGWPTAFLLEGLSSSVISLPASSAETHK
jgi:dihydroceramidase